MVIGSLCTRSLPTDRVLRGSQRGCLLCIYSLQILGSPILSLLLNSCRKAPRYAEVFARAAKAPKYRFLYSLTTGPTINPAAHHLVCLIAFYFSIIRLLFKEAAACAKCRASLDVRVFPS